MKKKVIRYLSILMTFCILFQNVSYAECAHDWNLEYDPYSLYDIIDEKYHIVSATKLHYICADCGEQKVEIQEASGAEKSKHRFNSNGVCYSCGFEMEEEVHEHDWEFEYDPYSIYDVIDEKYHIVSATELYYICRECGERNTEIEEASGAEKRKHRFNSKGICYDCGFEKEEVHEHDWELEDEEDWNYECANDEYHKVIAVKLHYFCRDCDETKTEIEDVEGNLKKHKFNDNNICKYCYYEKKAEITPTPTLVPTEVPTATPSPTLAPTEVPTATPVPTLAPTEVPTATLAPTPVPTKIPTPKPTLVPTEIPTIAPTVHVCIYKDSHWYQSYEYYNEEKHSYRHVITPICEVCGQKGRQTNNIEYGRHTFENGICVRCKSPEILVTEQEKEVAAQRIKELGELLDLVIVAMKNGEVLYDDATDAIKLLNSKIYSYQEILDNKRKFDTVTESQEIDIERATNIKKRLIRSGFGRNVSDSNLIAYYQIINNLEVTGWVTNETYNSVIRTVELKTEISKHLGNVEKLSAEKLVDLIGSGIQFIQENKSDEKACEAAYAEIEILVKYLKRTPEYLNNFSLANVDWIFKVGENTPGFKEIVDLAFTKENIYSNLMGTLADDYLEQYNWQYVANTLTLIDGVLIIGVGGAVVYEYAATGTVTLTVAGQTLGQTYEQLLAYAQKSGNLSKQAIDHIFKGFSKANGKISGVHYEKYLDNGIKVINKSATNFHGIYKGDVYVNGHIAKTGSTFFPENWTPTQIIDAINEAYSNIKTIDNVRNALVGVSGSGMNIEFLLDSAGKIISAYPLF